MQFNSLERREALRGRWRRGSRLCSSHPCSTARRYLPAAPHPSAPLPPPSPHFSLSFPLPLLRPHFSLSLWASDFLCDSQGELQSPAPFALRMRKAWSRERGRKRVTQLDCSLDGGIWVVGGRETLTELVHPEVSSLPVTSTAPQHSQGCHRR